MMYLAESSQGKIMSYRVADDGSLGGTEMFATVDDARLDGMTVDAEGFLWSALWGGHRVHRYSPEGELTDVVAVPAAQPTSIALSVDRPHRILVTTASHGRARSIRRCNPHRLDNCSRTTERSVRAVCIAAGIDSAAGTGHM